MDKLVTDMRQVQLELSLLTVPHVKPNNVESLQKLAKASLAFQKALEPFK
jgi:hypothetical protein